MVRCFRATSYRVMGDYSGRWGMILRVIETEYNMWGVKFYKVVDETTNKWTYIHAGDFDSGVYVYKLHLLDWRDHDIRH